MVPCFCLSYLCDAAFLIYSVTILKKMSMDKYYSTKTVVVK